MVMFEGDTMIIPRQTAHFGYYADKTETTLLTMEQTDIYKKDLIGLVALNQAGKIQMHSVPGQHLHITDEDLINIVCKCWPGTECIWILPAWFNATRPIKSFL
eukprot:TRINITY_DN50842_c0_g1_i1.p2 TRINITY_DN50842_c0_g1~~TRINITY_DN50842_c0_g1_i1.p2  ORF type:complete len:103 (-),score=9.88 TRINITY_DN50842_c0_g1_i1:294-602(-)